MAEPGAQSDPTHGVEASAGDATSEHMIIATTPDLTAESADTITLSEPTQNTGRLSNPNGRYHPINKDEWLLSTYINADWPGAMTVEDFSKVTAASNPGDSWWQDCHIHWALELIRRKHAQLDDVLVAHPFVCQKMYQAGIDFSYNLDKDSVDYRAIFAAIIEQLSSSNFVILPVNNAYQSAESNEHAAVEAGVADNNQPGYQGAGGHWSFIVVDRRDREKPSAHYVDGMVSPQKNKNKQWKIEGIEMNGVAAGKVLRGFDKILELEQGKFAARTLKFVPHMHKHNASGSRDFGSCGPHLYAFLDHILTRKASLIDPGLQTTFDDAESRLTRASELSFDSIATRRQFAEELLAERKRQEAQHPEWAPANITQEVLQSVMTVDGLSSLVRTVRGIGRPQSDTGTSDDDDEFTFNNDPALTKILREMIDASPTIYKNITDRTAQYKFAHDALIQEEKRIAAANVAKNPRKKRGPKPGKQKSNTIETYVGRNRYHNIPKHDPRINPAQETDIKFPTGYRHVHDFTTLSCNTLQRWVKAYDKIYEKVPDFKKDSWDLKARALLHIEINKTLFMQSDETYNKVWSKDTAVFGPNNKEYTDLVNEYKEKEDKRPMYGVMREMHMRYYMGDAAVDELLKFLEPYKAEEPSIGKKRKRDDKDSDDESSSDSDSNQSGSDDNSGKAKRVKSGQSGIDKGDVFNRGYNNDSGVNGKVSRHAEFQSSPAFQAIAGEAVDFMSMEEHHVVEWIHRVASQGFLTSSTEMVLPMRRLYLHRAFGSMITVSTLDKGTAAIYKEILQLDASLSYAQIIEQIDRLTEHVPMLRGKIQWYPDYYLQQRGVIAVKESKKENTETGSSKGDTTLEENAIEHGHDLFGGLSGDDHHAGLPDKDPLGDPEDSFLGALPENGPLKDPKDGSLKDRSSRDGSPKDGSSKDGSFDDDSSEDGSFGGLSSDASDDWDDGLNDDMSKALKASTTRKRKNAGELGPTVKRPKLSERDFLRMPLDEVRGWVSKMPRLLRDTFESRLEKYEDIRRARIWLERMFGEGFEHMKIRLPDSETRTDDGYILSEDEIKVKEYNLLSESDKRKLRLWHSCLPGFGRRGYTLTYHRYLHNTLLRDPIIDGRKVPIRPRLEELAKEMQSDRTDRKES
ncbi:hypothetical protein E8E13_009493 [Curvularia kusanoi]|uniref:Ubiquitin-like protease family profile domain-containing protein n=1 Tax=Curvularia kusanoi TaxID=90978 RepID=A0A9P4TQI9_CURKU|nr:hypothetical protein E8E13_009493 [Curvularia kusanoi]